MAVYCYKNQWNPLPLWSAAGYPAVSYTHLDKAKGDTDTKTEAADKSGEEKTLVYGSGDYTNINPALYEHGEINSLIFAGMTAHDAEDKVVPALAESWEWDEASKTYTFHLRKDVKFHDGETFTSADVKFTLDTIMNPDNASEIASNYEDITCLLYTSRCV